MKVSSPFIDLARVFEEVRGTGSKKAKVVLLSRYLAPLSPDDAEIAARVASGRSSERGSKDEAQVGYSTLLDVVREVTGASSEKVSRIYQVHGDLGEVVEELMTEKKEQPLFNEPLTLKEVGESFQRLRKTKGSGSAGIKKGIVKSLVLRASPLEGKYLVKVLTAEMRIGAVAGLLEEAIGAAYGLPKDEAARAHMVIGDLGTMARAAAEGKTGQLQIQEFRPVNFMLAEPFPDAKEIADHFQKPVLAEYKYDGVRAQVHKRGETTRIYSRRLEEITTSFPEVVDAVSGVKEEFILDGEIVPFQDGKPLPFQLLQRRLRRIEGFEETARKAPVIFFAFDLLLLNGKESVELPLSKRRKELARIVKGSGMKVAESTLVTTESEIGAAFRKSRELGYEGLVVKDLDSVYTMGKRGSGWVKLKEELDTIDAVIVAAEYGHGKRAGAISDYTFAVRDGDKLKVIGKAYSGLTDVEIDEMTRRLKEITVKDYGYRRSVRPEIVLEVAFDSIQQSDRHDSGYALRFPRIKRIRTDKGAADIDNLEKVQKIFSSQRIKVSEG